MDKGFIFIVGAICAIAGVIFLGNAVACSLQGCTFPAYLPSIPAQVLGGFGGLSVGAICGVALAY